MKKVVIAGSASLQDCVAHWERFWESRGYMVTASPREISRESYHQDYPAIHTEFYRALSEVDILFIMNEDKNGISGYIGAETFAELAYVVANNLLKKQETQVVLLKEPEERVQSYQEISQWLKLGWIQLLDITKV